MRRVFVLLALSVTLAGPANAQDLRPEAGAAPALSIAISPEERMARRHPQPLRAGDLVGLPLLDMRDRTLGRVERLVRDAQGKVVLVVRTGGWFDAGRPIGVPMETVAILGRQIALLDISRDAFLAAAEWRDAAATPIAADDTLRIALTRR